jgi:hypothetical protein
VLSINEKREKRSRKIILFFDIIFLPNCFILSASVIFQCHYQPIFISTKALKAKILFLSFHNSHPSLFSICSITDIQSFYSNSLAFLFPEIISAILCNIYLFTNFSLFNTLFKCCFTCYNVKCCFKCYRNTR